MKAPVMLVPMLKTFLSKKLNKPLSKPTKKPSKWKAFFIHDLDKEIVAHALKHQKARRNGLFGVCVLYFSFECPKIKRLF